MAQLIEIVSMLDQTLEPSRYRDAALNGLQVDSGEGNVTRVAVAVDSGLSIVKRALQAQAQLLIVHHGLFWGDESPLTGTFGQKVRLLMQEGCSLYASHLPLDGHPVFGNGVQLAHFLGCAEIAPAFPVNGMCIGAAGRFPKPLTCAEVAARCASLRPGIPPMVLPFGRNRIETVGVVTGSGTSALSSRAPPAFDLFISGEPKQSAYHLLKELELNAIFAGHYATETFGVRALGTELASRFAVESIFLDEETGI